SSRPVGDWRWRSIATPSPVFRFSLCPAGVSGGPSSKLSAARPPGDTTGAPPPTEAAAQGRGRQSQSPPESVRRQDSISIPHRPRRPPFFRSAPTSFDSFQIDAFAKLYRGFDGPGIGGGIWVADGETFLVPGGLREYTS